MGGEQSMRVDRFGLDAAGLEGVGPDRLEHQRRDQDVCRGLDVDRPELAAFDAALDQSRDQRIVRLNHFVVKEAGHFREIAGLGHDEFAQAGKLCAAEFGPPGVDELFDQHRARFV